jgi:PAS domain S-box-containing protein
MPGTTQQILQNNYRLLIESVKEHAIIMLDAAGYITSWNKGAEQIKGYSSDEIIGAHFSIFYTTEAITNGEPDRNLREAMKSGKFEHEAWRVRKDGSLFWADIVLTPLRDEKGNLVGFGKITRDLTTKRLAEDKIQVLNKYLETRLQQSQSEIIDYKHALDESSIVAITDQKGIITHVNDNFCRISKYSKEELLGQDHRIINSRYHPKAFIRDLWVTIANGKIWRGELKNKAKDGTIYWVDTTIVPFLNKHGKPYQYLAIRSDITQRKLAEEQLLKSNEELEDKVTERTLELTYALEREKELSEMKSRFVVMASHEFRTPLSAILSSTSLLEHYLKPEQDDKCSKHIDRIKSSVRNLTSILDDFLSLEKLEHGKVEIYNTEFNLQEFIEDVIEELDGMLKKKQQEIVYTYEGLSDVCQDKKILRNILLNLLSNAIKYSGVETKAQVICKTTENEVSILIEDRGMGIPAEAQQNLFGKFFRADNAVNVQGTGLGLNIVKRYIELIKGKISFTSQVNIGTTFKVEFPRMIPEG